MLGFIVCPPEISASTASARKSSYNSLSAADGKQAKFLFVAFALLHELAVLLAHVFNFSVVPVRQAQRHLQHFTRRVGVDMHFDHARVAGDHNGIAQPFQMVTEALDFSFCRFRRKMNDKKFRAVAVNDILAGKTVLIAVSADLTETSSS